MAHVHKHAEIIKAWADGAVIQWRFPLSPEQSDREWSDYEEPCAPDWNDEEAEFRIKPETASA